MEAKPRILCVDDEPNVLEGIALHVRRGFDMSSALSGPAALQLLEKDRSFAVIVSDMRMPGMDGATFLSQARKMIPDSVRILLTGQTDVESAVSAVNEGGIFRFLTKPCAPSLLVATLQEAAKQHRLISAERVLLEQTLRGSIQALLDILSLTTPMAFGRATRIKQRAAAVGTKLGIPDVWQLEVAAMLSQLGCVTLPNETLERLYYGQPLSEPEQAMVQRLPVVTEQLLANIPRLEGVREMLSLQHKPFRRPGTTVDDTKESPTARSAQILRAVSDLDTLEAQGLSSVVALSTLKGRVDSYSPLILEALAGYINDTRGGAVAIRELPVSALRVGMVVAEDIKLTAGVLLVARGYEITAGFLERVRNFRPGSVKEPIRIQLPNDAA